MATIRYEITDGILPFSVTLREGVSLIDINFHVSTGQYYFTEVPDGNYTITVIDAAGCETAFNVFVNCITTTVEPTTSTEGQQTTTTEEITTTHEDLPALMTCLDDALVYEGTLSFTPVSTQPFWTDGLGPTIVEDSTYIFIVFNDSTDNDYKYHIVWRYHKTTEAIATKTITTTNSYYGDYHKSAALMITSSGSLLVAIDQMRANYTHGAAMQIFRWADPSDLDTYSSTTVGNTTTERLSYPFFYEIGNTVIIEVKNNNTTLPTRRYYTSNDDGVTFGAITEYIDYGDSDYWIYKIQVRNNLQSKTDTILCIMPSNHDYGYNIFQYITYLKTDFAGNFYTLDGTNLGTSVTGVELTTYSSWGDTTKNQNLYYLQGSKLFGNDIYAIGYIGIMPTSTPNVTYMQIIKTNINTGAVTTGNLFPTKFDSSDMLSTMLFNICDDIYVKVIKNGIIYYYQIDADLNDITLIYTESANYTIYQATDMYCELTADYDSVTNTIRVFRMSDPDTVWDLTTTAEITTTVEPTTTGEPTTTAEPTTTSEPAPTTTAEPTTTVEPTTTSEELTTTQEINLCDGLISCWEFNETSGTTATDSQGDNDGTISGATINQTGKINKAYDFDGTNDYVNIGDIPDVDFGGGNFSIAFWIYAHSISGASRQQIFSKDASGQRQFELHINYGLPGGLWSEGNICFVGYISSTTYFSRCTNTAPITENTWTHVVIERNGLNLYCYINGSPVDFTTELSGTGNKPINDIIATSSHLRIGSRQYSGFEEYFDGLLDQVTVYGRALNSSEILYVVNSGSGLAYSEWDCPTTTVEPTTTEQPTTTEEVTTTSGG